jgi:hypothetical protein
MAWSWETSSLNPKNWGGGSSKSSAPKDNFDDSNEGYRSYSGGFRDDVTMGAISFGSSFESAADKLEEAGYSPAAIKDFQDRTKATMEANKPQPSDDNDSSPAPAAEAPKEEEVAEVVDESQSELDRLQALIDELSAQVYGGSFDRSYVSGPTEQEVVDREEVGPKSGTILTSAQGLETVIDPEDMKRLRKKRSLLASA